MDERLCLTASEKKALPRLSLVLLLVVVVVMGDPRSCARYEVEGGGGTHVPSSKSRAAAVARIGRGAAAVRTDNGGSYRYCPAGEEKTPDDTMTTAKSESASFGGLFARARAQSGARVQ